MADKSDELPSSDSGDEINDETWKRLFKKMTSRAQWAMSRAKETTGDYRDVVSSALRTQQRREQEGLVPPPQNAKELWSLLKECLDRKINKYRKAARSKKNQAIRSADLTEGADQVAWEQAFVNINDSPEQVEAYIEAAMQTVRDAVSDPELLEIAKLTMMSYDAAEIGERLQLSEHQVDRRLGKLRSQLKRHLSDGN